MWKKTEDLSGRVFGKWTVINRDPRTRCNVYWICKCECGVVKDVSNSHLRLGKSLSCRKCSEHKHKKTLNSRVWHKIVYNSKKKNREINFGETTAEGKKFLYDLLYVKQQSKCALSGFPITISNTIDGDTHGETTASLDRIDSSKGYTKDNVQWVHKCINFMKQDTNEKDFIIFCEAVVNKSQGKELTLETPTCYRKRS